MPNRSSKGYSNTDTFGSLKCGYCFSLGAVSANLKSITKTNLEDSLAAAKAILANDKTKVKQLKQQLKEKIKKSNFKSNEAKLKSLDPACNTN